MFWNVSLLLMLHSADKSDDKFTIWTIPEKYYKINGNHQCKFIHIYIGFCHYIAEYLCWNHDNECDLYITNICKDIHDRNYIHSNHITCNHSVSDHIKLAMIKCSHVLTVTFNEFGARKNAAIAGP